MAQVRVEFYGVARLRAGRSELTVEADTLRAALAATEAACPGLRLLQGEHPTRDFLISLDGDRFLADLNGSLPPGRSLLILGADAGG